MRKRGREREREREREGRTSSHVGDAGCIPLGEITVELIGTNKRYIQKKQKDKKLQTKKESRENYFVNKRIMIK